MITRCYVASFCNHFLLKNIISIRIKFKENIFLIFKGKYIQNSQHNSQHNDTDFFWAIRDLGLTATEVGKYLGLCKSAVSRAANRGQELIVDQFLILKD